MFWLLLLAGALDGIAAFSVPILLAEFTKPPVSFNVVSTLLPIIIVCLSVSLLLQWTLRNWGECLTGWLGNDLRLKLFERAERLTSDTLSAYHSGFLASLINQVSFSVGTIASNVVWLCGHILTTLSLFVYWTAKESVAMAVINLIILSIFVTVSVYLSRKIVPLADERNTTGAVLMERFIDFLVNINTVKKLGIIDWAVAKVRHESTVNDGSIYRFQRFHANRWCLLHSIYYSSQVATIGFLLYQVEKGALSASILILFIAGFARIQNYAERLSELIKSLIETNAYVDKLTGILSQEPSRGSVTVSPLARIECRDLLHRYEQRAQDIAIPIFTLKVGERVLISGVSGQGKSTFLSILADQRVPVEGVCEWNGHPYAEYNETLAHSFALVSQEAELFNLSLRENLVMGRDVADEVVLELLRELDLGDLLASLPEGLDTKVGEKGLRLSAGQKQRVNLARALLLERPVLLLDEPTSHLDAKTEEMVVERLARLSRSVTIVMVSHRPSLRALCDREYHFVNGSMVEVAAK